jgi:hypothetical protein
MRKLRTAWSSGQMFVLCGEAGIGKSRLLAEFAGNDPSVLISAARPGDAAVPLSTLARLLGAARERFKPLLDEDVAADLGRLVPQWAAPGWPGRALSTDADDLRLARALESFATACRAGADSGVLIDDLQFADNASAAWFRSLFDPSRAPQAPWRAGFATRGEAMNRGARELLEGLKASGQVVQVELAPLDLAAIKRLLESLQIGELRTESWTRALAQHAGGNPAFLLESIKTILAEGPMTCVAARLPVPVTVEAAVQRRLQQLDPDACMLAQLAAVAATAFSVSLASAVLCKPPLMLTTAFAELERLQILKGSAFVHDLVQEATLRSVPEAIRQVLHRTVAEYLESVAGASGVIAAHWQACSEWGRAAGHWRAAADAATVNSRPVDAADFLTRVNECLRRVAEAPST